MPKSRFLPIDRIWAQVDKSSGPDGCWPFMGLRSKAGYGRFRAHGRVMVATRVVMEIVTGQPVPNGLLVLHSCDNPPCVNPAHLRTGTHADNAADMVSRGRQADARNERSGKAKLTNWQVSLIRRRWVNGASQRSLAREFDVHSAHVSRLVRELRRPAEALPFGPASVDWLSRAKADREATEAYWAEGARLYAAGMTQAEVAEQIGCHPAALSRRLARMGVPTRRKIDYANQIDLDEMRRLHAAGVRAAHMVKIFGVCRGRIDKALDELGLPRFPAQNPRNFGRAA